MSVPPPGVVRRKPTTLFTLRASQAMRLPSTTHMMPPLSFCNAIMQALALPSHLLKFCETGQWVQKAAMVTPQRSMRGVCLRVDEERAWNMVVVGGTGGDGLQVRRWTTVIVLVKMKARGRWRRS